MLTLVLAPIFQQRQLYIQRVVAIYLYTLLLANLSPSVRLSGPATDSGLNIGWILCVRMNDNPRGTHYIYVPINLAADQCKCKTLSSRTIEDVVWWISTDTALL